MYDPQELVPQQGLSLIDQHSTALAQQMNISYEDARSVVLTALRTEVLNELMNGDWHGKENGLEILQERLKDVDLQELFHDFHLNPVIGAQGFVEMLSERFPGLGPNARPEDATILGPMLEESNE